MDAIILMISFLTTAVMVESVRRWAGHRLIDVPGPRSSHARPTIRGGGLPIVMIVIAGVLLVDPSITMRTKLWAYIAGSGLIAVVSFLDDLKNLPWYARLAAHSLAAGIIIFTYGGLDRFAIPGLGTFRVAEPVGVIITFFWIVGLTNAYNFMDGIDGIVAGQTILAALAWTVVAMTMYEPIVQRIALLLLGCASGFLIHNWPPAKIFLGDVGSAFLGFTFATLPLLTENARPTLAVIAPLLVAPFILDTTFTFFRRALRREHVFSAHRSHLYQRLVMTGLSHGQVSLLYTGLALLGGATATAIVQGWRGLALGCAAAFLAAAATSYVVVIRREAGTPLRA